MAIRPPISGIMGILGVFFARDELDDGAMLFPFLRRFRMKKISLGASRPISLLLAKQLLWQQQEMSEGILRVEI